ncbi:hypothetical protein MD588_22175 [Photobacterium sp. SDRW27]|uniref:hypothetical protein n=1 Tax=Photobacterium obscurum TaxID=2829490 RepID=UPI00224396FE|nr:hypothetical protein [Photobacterium obscurum]MCW8331507.1 hypothetical protein [Photobacterium obscurum]
MSSKKTRYITTDLDVFSVHDLSALAAFLQDKTCILHCGWREEGLFHLCLEPQTEDATVEADLASLLDATEQLPESLIKLWHSASEVDFNLGIETGDCHGHNTKIPAQLLQRITKLGGTLIVTTYPAE